VRKDTEIGARLQSHGAGTLNLGAREGPEHRAGARWKGRLPAENHTRREVDAVFYGAEGLAHPVVQMNEANCPVLTPLVVHSAADREAKVRIGGREGIRALDSLPAKKLCRQNVLQSEVSARSDPPRRGY